MNIANSSLFMEGFPKNGKKHLKVKANWVHIVSRFLSPIVKINIYVVACKRGFYNALLNCVCYLK